MIFVNFSLIKIVSIWLNLHGYSQQPPNTSPSPVMLAAMAFTSSHSLSLIWVSLFSPSLKPSIGPCFCFHSHLSPLAVLLIDVTTTGGHGSSSLSLYFLSLLFFFSIFICLLDKTETPLTLTLFHFFISLMNNILFQF